ncbi:MAG: threonylcarbamoyl-AMP synthase [Clostridia bacterium]|nr:threonylcarbamoyl-AMP synthase [Clostridia bacterium]
MVTKVLKVSNEAVKEASNYILNGDVVAIPTETVYGIAGNAYNGDAIKKIFLAKGRPQDNPLIVHISDMDMLKEVAIDIPKDAYKLASKFWPGPLTMVLKKSDKVSLVTTAGLDSVGVRMPSDKFAHDLIVNSGVPFAAPSANISGKPSPTNANDVYLDMQGRLPLVVDGGDSLVGVESTVLSLLTGTPVLLRPGYVTKEDIEAVLGKEVILSGAVIESLKEGETARSPGMKYKHYAPEAEVIIIDANLDKFTSYVNDKTDDGLYCLVFDGEGDLIIHPTVSYGKTDDAKSQAHNLFTALRTLDKLGAKKVYARAPLKDGVALAVYNRLLRAAGFKEIKL